MTDDVPLEDDGFSIEEIIIALGIFLVMIGVGASCERKLFMKMFRSPKAMKAAAVGILCQFFFMPVSSYLLTIIFNVKGYAALGMTAVGALPGGSSSNVYTQLGGGVLELSVFMTIVSTLFSFGLLPLWLYIWSHVLEELGPEAVPLDDVALQFVLLVVPLALGVALNYCIPSIKKRIETSLGILSIIVFFGSIVVVGIGYPDALREAEARDIVPAVIYFPIAAGFGYGIAKLAGFRPAVCRTIFFEVGLQNLALGFGVALVICDTEAQFNDLLPFPITYAMIMLGLSFVAIPVFRWQKRRNEENGVMDSDPDFLLEDEEVQDDSNYIKGDITDAEMEEAKTKIRNGMEDRVGKE